MQKYEVKFTTDFRDKVQKIYDYIVQEYSDPLNATRLVERIERRCRRLAIFPKGYAVKVVRGGKEYRFMHVNRYTIAFTVNDERKIVAVRTLFYPGQDVWRALRSGDREDM